MNIVFVANFLTNSFRARINTPYDGARTLEAILDFAKRATRYGYRSMFANKYVSEPIQTISEDNFSQFKAMHKVGFLLIDGTPIGLVDTNQPFLCPNVTHRTYIEQWLTSIKILSLLELLLLRSNPSLT